MLETGINKIIDSNINMVVPWYLMLSYGYYILDESVVSDSLYDSLAKTYLDNYDKINHIHKELVDKSDLRAGTLYHLRENDYPLIVRSAFVQVLNKKGSDL